MEVIILIFSVFIAMELQERKEKRHREALKKIWEE